MKRKLWALLVAAVVVATLGAGASSATAATGNATQPKLNVFAAASLYKAFPAMVAPFKAKYPQYKYVRFVFNFNGTDILTQQLEGGAPADIFAGASTKYDNELIGKGLINSPRFFSQNKLCVIVPRKNPASITTLLDLARSTATKGKPIPMIAIGDSTVPIGDYTGKVLSAMSKDPLYGAGYKDAVMANVAATVANVNMITALVTLDEVDAGFVYNSDKVAAGAAVTRMVIPNQYQTNPLPTYPIATVKTAARPLVAQRFISFVMSARGQMIMARWGFLPKPTPIITSISPTSGLAGSDVTISGTNFFPGTVKIGGIVATTSAWTTTQITATVPASLAAGATTVTVTSDGRTSKPVTFTVTT